MLNKIFNLLDLNSSDVFLDLFAGSSILSVNAKHLFNCSTIINDFDNILPLDLEYALENILSFEGNRKNFTLARTKYFIKRLRRGWLKKVEKYNQILNSPNIVHFDYKEILNKIIKKEFIYNVTKMYVDPPYYDKEGLYIKSFLTQDHLDLHKYLSKLKQDIKMVISYNDEPFIRELYKDWKITVIDKTNVSGRGKWVKTTELLITNERTSKNE